VTGLLVVILAVEALPNGADATPATTADCTNERSRPSCDKPAKAGAAGPRTSRAEATIASVPGLPPSQIGIGTLAQFAHGRSAELDGALFKDADKPMHPSSMAKMDDIYSVSRVRGDQAGTKFRVRRAWRIQGSKMFVEINSESASTIS